MHHKVVACGELLAVILVLLSFSDGRGGLFWFGRRVGGGIFRSGSEREAEASFPSPPFLDGVLPAVLLRLLGPGQLVLGKFVTVQGSLLDSDGLALFGVGSCVDKTGDSRVTTFTPFR